MAIRGPEDFTLRTLVGVLQAIVPALLMNVSIVGFNQVCDVEIDKARPSGELTSPLLAAACRPRF
jgi:hypothetical protein